MVGILRYIYVYIYICAYLLLLNFLFLFPTSDLQFAILKYTQHVLPCDHLQFCKLLTFIAVNSPYKLHVSASFPPNCLLFLRITLSPAGS